MKKIVICLLPGFELMEFSPFIDVFGWNRLLGSKDIEVETASFEKTVVSSWGQRLEVNRLFSEVLEREYDALIFPGGFGKYGFFSSLEQDRLEPSLFALLEKFQKSQSYILAICTASIYLAASKLFPEKEMTSYLLEEERYFKQLSFYGVKARPEEIVKDDSLWTSSSPATSLRLAFDLLEELSSAENCKKIFSLMGFHDRIEQKTK